MTTLRCKLGDMAIIVAARRQENLGKFVTVVDSIGWLSPGQEFVHDGTTYKSHEGGFMWICEGQTQFVLGTVDEPQYRKNALCYDHNLMPIRPEPDEDDTDEEKTVDKTEEIDA